MLLSSSRRLLPAAPRATLGLRYNSVGARTPENPLPANDPKPQSEQSPSIGSTNKLATSAKGVHDGALQETNAEAEAMRVMQSPNRATTWSRSQQPRAKAMTGPRFEQTIMADQPRPLAAIDLIHKQPVRWTNKRVVSCDGGGGPLGHPRIFINVDKPQISWCTYCGLPFAHHHHRKHLESLASTTYPLEPTGDPAAIPNAQIMGKTGSTEPYQSPTGAPLEQR